MCNKVSYCSWFRCKCQLKLMRLAAPISRAEFHASADLFCKFDQGRLWVGNGRLDGVQRSLRRRSLRGPIYQLAALNFPLRFELGDSAERQDGNGQRRIDT